jgi:Right handed beta helix region
MGIVRLQAALAAIGLVAACREPTTVPVKPSFADGAPTTCPLAANFVVTDETSLRGALSAASPGNVIALNGFFAVTADVAIATPSVTLTCATPGSGIFAPPTFSGLWLLQVLAAGVTVDRLVLDGGRAPEGPYVAGTDGTLGFFADTARLTNNSVTCGSPNGECAFFVGTRLAVVADNSFASAGSGTGVHMQSGIDDSRIERNTIVTTAPSGGEFLGGIRVRDGNNVVVMDNVVRGPWGNAIAPTNLTRSQFQNNRMAGPSAYGVRFGAALSTGNEFRNNQVTSVGTAGIFVQAACSNSFLGNTLEGNGRAPSAIFTSTTGANVLVLIGAKNLVIDNGGSFDCNGDGVGDPNIIAGPGRVVHGVSVGSSADAGAASSGRLR